VKVHTGKGHTTSRVPAGVNDAGSLDSRDHAPSKRFSLWAHYSYRIDQAFAAHDTSKLLMLAAAARRDYEEYCGLRRPAIFSDHADAVKELLRDYVGVHSREVAIWLGAPEKWVKRHRLLNSQDPTWGDERITDDALQQIVDLANEGRTLRSIATVVGVSHVQVKRILDGETRAA
jgi:hypothetical protein